MTLEELIADFLHRRGWRPTTHHSTVVGKDTRHCGRVEVYPGRALEIELQHGGYGDSGAVEEAIVAAWPKEKRSG